MPALEGMSIDDLRDTVRALKQRHYDAGRGGGLSAIELARYMDARRLYSAKLDALPVVKGVSTAGICIDPPSAVFVVVEDDGQRTLDSVRNIGVFSSLHAATACAWRAILEHASKPWTAAFYEDREAEFAHLCGVPYFTVEEWTSPSFSKKHLVGWRDAASSGGEQDLCCQDLCWFDASLKRECKKGRYDAYVRGLLRDLVERSRFPREREHSR